MTQTDEQFLELAYRAEKIGDRNEAIRLYRRIASGTSEHAEYALNCAENLEQLGSPIPKDAESKQEPTDTISSNPFSSPTSVGVGNSVYDYSNQRRNQFTANVVRALAVFCLATGLYSCLQTLVSFSVGSGVNWTQWLVVTILDILIIVGWFNTAWFCSQHAVAIQRLLPLSKNGYEYHTKRQLRLWIALGILAALFVLRELSWMMLVREITM